MPNERSLVPANSTKDMKKSTMLVLGIVVILGGAYLLRGGNNAGKVADKAMIKDVVGTNAATENHVKEFTVTSWYEVKDGKPTTNFSMKEIAVTKGDTVRIKVTNTKGVHDFAIDEFGVKTETPEGVETIIEFVADKVGEFTYYCSKPGHKALGQTGTLVVSDTMI